jgi:hypothetical protein
MPPQPPRSSVSSCRPVERCGCALRCDVRTRGRHKLLRASQSSRLHAVAPWSPPHPHARAHAAAAHLVCCRSAPPTSAHDPERPPPAAALCCCCCRTRPTRPSRQHPPTPPTASAQTAAAGPPVFGVCVGGGGRGQVCNHSSCWQQTGVSAGRVVDGWCPAPTHTAVTHTHTHAHALHTCRKSVQNFGVCCSACSSAAAASSACCAASSASASPARVRDQRTHYALALAHGRVTAVCCGRSTLGPLHWHPTHAPASVSSAASKCCRNLLLPACRCSWCSSTAPAHAPACAAAAAVAAGSCGASLLNVTPACARVCHSRGRESDASTCASSHDRGTGVSLCPDTWHAHSC